MRRVFIVAMVLWCMSIGQAHSDSSGFLTFYIPPGPLRGVDTIPLDAMKVSDEEMQNLFILTDLYTQHIVDKGFPIPFLKGHAEHIRKSACKAYITQCSNHNDPLTTPFTFLAQYNPLPQNNDEAMVWLIREIKRRGGKIVTASGGIGSLLGFFLEVSLPFVVIKGIGNEDVDSFWEAGNGNFHAIRESVKEQRVIYTSSYVVDQGKPRRHKKATGCVGVEESCVYLPVNQMVSEGTSFQSPTLGAALASLLAVFPEYDPFDLVMLTNSCADRYPTLPGSGVVNVPCMIETICEEINSDSSACDIEQPEPISMELSVGVLENPPASSDILYAERSGVSTISGWVCDAEKVMIEINGVKQPAAYGTSRIDTEGVCGDEYNGFGLLFNWNNLGDGIHSVKAYADGVEFASTQVKVTTLGEEFLTGVADVVNIGSFGNQGNVFLRWVESTQNYAITDTDRLPAEVGYRSVKAVKAVLESPSLGSFQSGISTISGWVCDAEEIMIEIGGVKQPAAYGTSRIDTEGVCGDEYSGFGLLFNWNNLGDGIHSVKAYADGVEFASTQVKVTTLGEEFLTGVSRKIAEDTRGHSITVTPHHRVVLEWQETLQNFTIIGLY